MTITAPAIISLIALLFYSVLLWVVISREYKSRINQSFALYLLTMILWSFGSFMLFADTGRGNTLFWNRFMLIGSMGMPIAFFGFVQVFLMRDWRQWLGLGALSYVAILAAAAQGQVIADAYISQGKLNVSYGPGMIFSSGLWVIFIGFSALSLIREYRKTLDIVFRNRIRYLLAVILVIFTGSLTNATALQAYPVDISFNIISALLIAYAILRHQILDITVVVRKGLLYSIPTVLISVSYFLVISLAIRIFHTPSDFGIILVSLAVAVLTALVAQPLRERAQSWVDRLFYREKYDSSQMLQRLSHTAASVLDLKKLTSMILSEVTSVLHIRYAAILIKQEESGDFYLIAQWGLPAGINLKLSRQHPLVLQLNAYDQVLTRYDMEIMPQFKALWKQEQQELEQISAELFIPLRAKGELVGVFTVGPKLSEETYSQDEHLTLLTLANQTATAIENARLFASEARRREEAETLQNALSELTSDLELQKVLENILVRLEQVIPYDSACVFLLQDSSLHAVAARGFENVSQVIGRNYNAEEDDLFREIQHTRLPLVLNDASADPRFKGYGNTHAVQGWMGVPLIARGTVIGYLTLDSYTPNAYTQADTASLAQSFASHAAISVENARLFQVEREQRQLAEAFREIGAVLNTTLDFNNVLDLLLEQVGRIVHYDVAHILLMEDNHLQVARRRAYEQAGSLSTIGLGSLSVDPAHSPWLAQMISSAEPLIVSDIRSDPKWADRVDSDPSVGSWAGVPILINGEVIACFSLVKFEPGYYHAEHAGLLTVFGGQAALALQNARLFSEIQMLAITDDLTGIFNRRHFFELGEREFNRAQRFSRPLSVLMLDLDHFKLVNDNYGHAVGDQVLRVIAERFKSNVRDVDVLGRYGGEEFTILLPETGISEAKGLSERLREIIAKTPVPTSAGSLRITVSLGVASLDSKAQSLAELIECADQAMYAAKKRGRNFVCAYTVGNAW